MTKIPQDNEQPGDRARNKKGQFETGHTGNPRGRPKKKKTPATIPSPTRASFANTLVDIKNAQRQTVVMTRRELNHLRLFEAAAKGDVRAQIYLDRKFEKWTRSKPPFAQSSSTWRRNGC